MPNKKIASKRDHSYRKGEVKVGAKRPEEPDEWHDEKLRKKEKKREEAELKHQALLDKKAEIKALIEKELATLGKTKTKFTRAEVEKPEKKEAKEVKRVEKQELLLENPNRKNVIERVDFSEGGPRRKRQEEAEARNVEEALALFQGQKKPDKHPEKRRKSAFYNFQERRLAVLRDLNPELRMSQLKEIVFKEWSKSPENPVNKDKYQF